MECIYVESTVFIRKESLTDHQSSKKARCSAILFSTGNKNIAPETKAMHISAVNSSRSLKATVFPIQFRWLKTLQLYCEQLKVSLFRIVVRIRIARRFAVPLKLF